MSCCRRYTRFCNSAPLTNPCFRPSKLSTCSPSLGGSSCVSLSSFPPEPPLSASCSLRMTSYYGVCFSGHCPTDTMSQLGGPRSPLPTKRSDYRCCRFRNASNHQSKHSQINEGGFPVPSLRDLIVVSRRTLYHPQRYLQISPT